MTPKQARFVDEYLVDLNATQAAIRAGYSARTAEAQASRLLRNVNVSKAIEVRAKAREKRTEITQDKVLTDIEAIKRDAMREALDKDGNATMVNHAAALKACELQGRHLAMFSDKLAVTHAFADLSDEELIAEIAALGMAPHGKA